MKNVFHENIMLQGVQLTLFIAFMLQIVNPNPVEVYSQFLDQFKWKKRVLLVAASDWKSESFRQMRRILDSRKSEVEVRDFLVLSVIGFDRDSFSLLLVEETDFRILLLGKDGTVKFESHEVVTIDSIFELIDAMPMREREIE